MMPSASAIYYSMISLHVVLLVLLLLPLSSIWASEYEFKLDGKVLELRDSNFDAAISTFDYVFVDFYAPRCGHCKRLAPELDKAAPILAGLKKPIVVAKVDADKYKSLASKHDIDGYPTLKVFLHGVSTEYYGPRNADLLARHLVKFFAPDVAILSSDSSIREFIEAAGSYFPIFIGFGLNESTISNLAIKYKKRAWFSVAKDFSDDIMTKYDLDKAPALAAIHLGSNEHSIFYGPLEEKFLENYIKHNFFPLVLPLNQETLELLEDDPRKIVVTILNDEGDEKSKGLLKVLKAAASENRDLVFGYVGFKQWEDFAESFDVSEKTKLPKMVLWDGNEKYYLVIGSERIDETDMGTQVSRFLEGYRVGRVMKKHYGGSVLMDFINSQLGGRYVLILIFVALVMVLIRSTNMEEPPTVGIPDQVDDARNSTVHPETKDLRRNENKED
ncbi:protein disulfide isomerase-like 5-2 [Primulina huaijiensis]|uniref:protein disulfide isomerase-like 5-2 n=1 Tax=Primulina huaijiensis TaxID=1492673 RepID=UPI003CC750D4